MPLPEAATPKAEKAPEAGLGGEQRGSAGHALRECAALCVFLREMAKKEKQSGGLPEILPAGGPSFGACGLLCAKLVLYALRKPLKKNSLPSLQQAAIAPDNVWRQDCASASTGRSSRDKRRPPETCEAE